MHQLACSLLLLAVLLSPASLQDLASSPQASSLQRRQLPSPAGSPSPLTGALFDPIGTNRAVEPTKGSPSTTSPSPVDPAASSSVSSSQSAPSATPKDPQLGDSLLPLLGSAPFPITPSPASSSIPTSSAHPLSPSSSITTTSTSTASVSTPTPLPPTRGQLPNSDLTTTSTASSAASSPSGDSTNRNSRPPAHKADDNSGGFGATTIKLIAIIAAVVGGLFLLWTIIRKWKFRPSKRFAKKLDDYDEDVFAPRPPSFGEKRGNDYQAYSIPKPPNSASAFASPYPSYPERSVSPQQKISYGNDLHQGSQGYQNPRLSHISITQPPAMFEPSPYRISLGLGNVPHAYPPSDHTKPTAM
ncbi:hypothetical protein PCANC_17075 [Puccinia coronata f. sp. avenae]|uniref:REJ domain-containing protein n=1 Tax=Puccinia coronata f. sp. avenae TaxID=200324 RepID=A0A2N5SLB0_9BASI|nr:hypothetical protein PCANC_17075 [Puccinia coronata f. sp. avenae]